MIPDELSFDETFIRGLLSEQAPQWAGLPIRPVPSSGTDNALYRLGDDLVLRIPRRPSAIRLLRKELDWLPRLAGLPLAIPHVHFRGLAPVDDGCPFGVFDWIDGDIATPDAITDPTAAALALAGFLKALHRVNTIGAPPAGEENHHRGVALGSLSPLTMAAIDTLSDEMDGKAAHALWRAACHAPQSGPPVWLHGDLKADNLVARNGTLRAVIDWGLCGIGDPAADYAAAWSWIDPTARETFRRACDVSDADWLRASGWALYGAVIALSYYRGGLNEPLCQQSRLTLARLGMC